MTVPPTPPDAARPRQRTAPPAVPAHGPTAPPKGQRAVQSIEVGGRVLLALSASPGPLALKDLAERAGLSASRAHPYLVSFGRLGLVVQDPASGHYALGPAALQLGLTCLRQLEPVNAAWPLVQALAQSSGHAVALAVWGNFGPTIVRMVDARQPLHVAMRAGTVMSILGTATGRAFAAVLPPQRLAAAAAVALGDADATTAHARPLDAMALQQAIDELRQHGVARAVGLPMPGVNAFSAVAFDHEGQPVLVLTVLDHQDRLPADWGCHAALALRDAAAQVSARLGWAPSQVGQGVGVAPG